MFVNQTQRRRLGAIAVVDDDVSLLHNVTLGGTGKECGDRRPKVRKGRVIGAGAKIHIEIGTNSRIPAGSVVLRLVVATATVAGASAKGDQGSPITTMPTVGSTRC